MNVNIDVIPIEIGVLSIHSQQFFKSVPDFSDSLLCHLQKAALLGIIHTLQKLICKYIVLL